MPTFVPADRLAVTGAQPRAVLRGALEQAARTGSSERDLAAR